MAASEVRAGRAFVELSLQDKFSKGLDQAARKLKAVGDSLTNIGKRLAGVGLSITGPLILAAQQFASIGNEINKASARTGIGVQQLTALKYAAEQSGASFEDFEGGIRKMNKAIFEAEGGSKEARAALASIGITAKELKGLSPDEQFITIAQALSQVKDAGAKAAISMQIFGKGGTSLIPLMDQGADGINKLIERADALGLIFSKEDADAATKFHDTLADLWKQVTAVTFQVGAAVAQALQPFATSATKVMASIIAWTREHRSLIIALLVTGATITGLGVAVLSLGLSLKVAGAALSGITSTLKLTGAVVGLLTNPVVLVGAALAVLIGYFFVASDTGHKCVAFLIGKFNDLKVTAVEAFGGIADALSAGDIVLAGQILWAGLQLLWLKGTAELQAKWAQFKAGFVQTAAAAFYGSLELYEGVKARLLTAFENTTSFLGDLWSAFIGLFTDSWNGAVNLVTKGLNLIHGLWDKTFDSKSANKAADQLLDQQKAARRAAEIAGAGNRENERKKNVGRINADELAAVKSINDREIALSAAASANGSKEIADLEAKKKALQEQLDALRGKAKKEAGATALGSLLNNPTTSIDDVLDQRQAVANPIKSAGLFNAAAIQSLEAGPTVDYQRRTAKAAEEIAKNTKNKATFK